MPFPLPFPLPLSAPLRPLVATGLTTIALSACDVTPNPTTTGPGGVTEIQIASGLNCFDNKCFKYDPQSGAISVNGRRPTAPPPGVTLSDGSITAAEFSATFQTGMMAHTIGESNR